MVAGQTVHSLPGMTLDHRQRHIAIALSGRISGEFNTVKEWVQAAQPVYRIQCVPCLRCSTLTQPWHQIAQCAPFPCAHRTAHLIAQKMTQV